MVNSFEIDDSTARLIGEWVLPVKRMQHDSFDQVTEGHIMILGQALQDFQQPFLEPDTGLHPFYQNTPLAVCLCHRTLLFDLRTMVHIYLRHSQDAGAQSSEIEPRTNTKEICGSCDFVVQIDLATKGKLSGNNIASPEV